MKTIEIIGYNRANLGKQADLQTLTAGQHIVSAIVKQVSFEWLRFNVRTSRVRTVRIEANRRYSRQRCACCKRVERVAQAQSSCSITNLM